MGVAEARLYRDLAHELPVRVPHAWYAEFEGTGTDADDRYVMVLEDLVASGCRFPTREDADIEARIFDIVEQPRRACTRSTGRARASAPGGDLDVDRAPQHRVRRRRRGHGADGDRQPRRPAPRRASSTSPRPTSRTRPRCCSCYREGECTLVHGDPHLGNLFVDGDDPRRTGFLDWAVLAHAPGIRDVAYVLANSTPTELRRTHEPALLDALPRGARRARRHARRRPRVGAVPPVHDLRLVLRRPAPRRWVRSGSPSTSASAAPNGRRSPPSTSTAPA